LRETKKNKMEGKKMRKEFMKDMDRLEHSVTEGFYDKELDMFFRDLQEWCKFKYGKTLGEMGI